MLGNCHMICNEKVSEKVSSPCVEATTERKRYNCRVGCLKHFAMKFPTTASALHDKNCWKNQTFILVYSRMDCILKYNITYINL